MTDDSGGVLNRGQPARCFAEGVTFSKEEEIISIARERVAAYEYPRRVVFMDGLPKTATGKILKRELQEREREKVAK